MSHDVGSGKTLSSICSGTRASISDGARNVAIGRTYSEFIPVPSELERLQAERFQIELQRAHQKNEALERDAALAKQQAHLKEMPPEKEVAPLCKICTIEPAEMLLEACGHIGTCVACTKQIQTCPICRVAITTSKKVFVVV